MHKHVAQQLYSDLMSGQFRQIKNTLDDGTPAGRCFIGLLHERYCLETHDMPLHQAGICHSYEMWVWSGTRTREDETFLSECVKLNNRGVPFKVLAQKVKDRYLLESEDQSNPPPTFPVHPDQEEEEESLEEEDNRLLPVIA